MAVFHQRGIRFVRNGRRAPRCDVINWETRSARTKLRKPRLEIRPAVPVDIENAGLNCGRNRPKPILAGPYVMAVAAKPAAESVRKGVMIV